MVEVCVVVEVCEAAYVLCECGENVLVFVVKNHFDCCVVIAYYEIGMEEFAFEGLYDREVFVLLVLLINLVLHDVCEVGEVLFMI